MDTSLLLGLGEAKIQYKLRPVAASINTSTSVMRTVGSGPFTGVRISKVLQYIIYNKKSSTNYLKFITWHLDFWLFF